MGNWRFWCAAALWHLFVGYLTVPPQCPVAPDCPNCPQCLGCLSRTVHCPGSIVPSWGSSPPVSEGPTATEKSEAREIPRTAWSAGSWLLSLVVFTLQLGLLCWQCTSWCRRGVEFLIAQHGPAGDAGGAGPRERGAMGLGVVRARRPMAPAEGFWDVIPPGR